MLTVYMKKRIYRNDKFCINLVYFVKTTVTSLKFYVQRRWQYESQIVFSLTVADIDKLSDMRSKLSGNLLLITTKLANLFQNSHSLLNIIRNISRKIFNIFISKSIRLYFKSRFGMK